MSSVITHPVACISVTLLWAGDATLIEGDEQQLALNGAGFSASHTKSATQTRVAADGSENGSSDRSAAEAVWPSRACAGLT